MDALVLHVPLLSKIATRLFLSTDPARFQLDLQPDPRLLSQVRRFPCRVIDANQGGETSGAIGLPPALDLTRRIADERGDGGHVRRFVTLEQAEQLDTGRSGRPAQPLFTFI